MKPTVGQTVQWITDTGEVEAAIITRVHDAMCVNLTIFDAAGGMYAMTSATFNAEGAPLSWRWV